MGPIVRLLGSLLRRSAHRAAAEFVAAAKDPRATQRRVLFDLLRRQAGSAFGRDHGFGSVDSVETFRRNVPVTTYEYVEPYIERVKNGETTALFASERVLMFALTSGTTNARKFIPVTERAVADYNRLWSAWGLAAFSEHRGLLLRAKLALVSDGEEFRTAAGIPCGSVSGLSANRQTAVVRASYVMPAVTQKVHDAASKYCLAWRLGLVRDVGLIVSPNPSTLVNLARVGDREKERLIRDLRDGTLAADLDVPAAVRKALASKLRKDRRRADELERIVARTGRLLPKDAWPKLGLIGCWTGGSVGAYLRQFPEWFGDTAVRDIGLLASEGRMTVPKDDHTPSGILEVTSTFFEFVPVAEIDSPSPTVLEAHELEEGGEYYILLTTSTGLYRYHISDVVRCTGRFEQTPLLEFLHKGSRIANVTGEKLAESQVSQAVAGALADVGLALPAFALAPCWDDERPWYGLFVELPAGDRADALAAAVERRLRTLNIEYDAKRSSGRLGPVRVEPLPPGTWDRWDAARLARTGGTAEQYKRPCLMTDLSFAEEMRRRERPAEKAVPA